MLRRLIVTCMLLQGACDKPEELIEPVPIRVEIRPAAEQYRRLNWAVFRIRNLDTEILYQEMCNVVIEGRRTSTEPWSTTNGSGRGCLPGKYVSPRAIAPGESVLDSLPVAADSYEGEWRLRAIIFDGSGRTLRPEEVVSYSFHVVAGR